jgi:hypothetical protein
MKPAMARGNNPATGSERNLENPSEMTKKRQKKKKREAIFIVCIIDKQLAHKEEKSFNLNRFFDHITPMEETTQKLYRLASF